MRRTLVTAAGQTGDEARSAVEDQLADASDDDIFSFLDSELG